MEQQICLDSLKCIYPRASSLTLYLNLWCSFIMLQNSSNNEVLLFSKKNQEIIEQIALFFCQLKLYNIKIFHILFQRGFIY